jgi:hypothetical protein
LERFDQTGLTAHDKFLQWCRDNVGGFVVNTWTDGEVRLHHASCASFLSKPYENVAGRSQKLCGTRNELAELLEQSGPEISKCSMCWNSERSQR